MCRLLLPLAAILVASACATAPVRPDVHEPAPSRSSRKTRPQKVETGVASFYADALHGRRTASGQPYDKKADTCAHRSHRFGTRLEVVVLDTGRKAICRVNDRGPFVEGRIVDVSRSLAEKLGFVQKGLARVEVRQVAD